MDQAEAQQRQAAFESYEIAMKSAFGQLLRKEMEAIKTSAVSESMKPVYGDEAHQRQVEARGRYLAMMKLEALFERIDRDYMEALPTLEAEIKESAPVDTSA